MAVLHKGSTISPTKPELLETMLGGPVEILGSYRFDDPDGEVGIEGFVVRRDESTRHVLLTYRGAALPGADDHRVSTMQHTELGPRWVYDAAGDPVALECLRRAALGEQDQAALELWEDNKLVGVREPTVQLTAIAAGDVSEDTEVTVRTDLDAEPPTEGAWLELAWDGGHGVIATLG